MKNRIIRLSAAATLLLGVAALAVPHATSYISTSAVINAPLIVIRSPMDGVLVQESGPPSERIGQGQGTIEIQQDNPDRTAVAELDERQAFLTSKIGALHQELSALLALENRILLRKQSHLAIEAARNEAKLRQIAAEVAAAEADLAEARTRVRRNAELKERGTVAQSAIDKDAAELSGKTAAVERARGRLDDQKIVAAGVRQGLLTDFENSSDDEEHLDAIAMRIADLRTRIATDEAELKSTLDRLTDEEWQLKQRSNFAPLSPADGVVWRASHGIGSKVMTGDEVVQIADCAHRFVEVALPERHFGIIRPGTQATVYLSGSASSFKAHVDTVRGSGARMAAQDYAAELKDPLSDQMIVVVRFDPPSPEEEPDGSFCSIGRTAEVRFDRSLLQDILPVSTVAEDLVAMVMN